VFWSVAPKLPSCGTDRSNSVVVDAPVATMSARETGQRRAGRRDAAKAYRLVTLDRSRRRRRHRLWSRAIGQRRTMGTK
jgi:hypothetical protein